MPHIQLGYLVNPNRAHVKCERSFPRETDLYDLTEDAIPDDAQFIGATDDTGLCVGTTSAARVRKILQVIKQIPLEPLLDELDEAVVAVNLEGTIFYVNLAYTKILGVPAGKILGKDLHIIESGASLLDVLHSGAPIVRDMILWAACWIWASTKLNTPIRMEPHPPTAWPSTALNSCADGRILASMCSMSTIFTAWVWPVTMPPCSRGSGSLNAPWAGPGGSLPTV